MTPLRRLGALVVAASAVLGTAGCWDVHDVNDLTPVLSVGLDHTGGRWTMTVEDAVVGSGGTSAFQSVPHHGYGSALSTAIDDLRAHLARRLYVGSARVFVIGHGALEGDVRDIVRRLTESQEVDETAFLVASATTAAALLAHRDGVFGTTSVRLIKEFDSPEMAGHAHLETRVWEAQRDLSQPGPGSFAAIPVFGLSGEASALELGTALIGPDGRLATVLDRDQSATMAWIMSQPGREVLPLPDGNRVEPVSARASAQLVDARHLSLHVRLGAVAYYVRGPAVIRSALRAHLEHLAAQVVLERTLSLVRRLEAAGVDPAGWSLMAERQGLRPFDIRHLHVALTVSVTLAPHFAKSL
jgi:hypothetical protein